MSAESRRFEQVISGVALALLLIGCAIVLRPFDASVGRDGTIAHSSSSTRIVLEPGRTVALGGILRDAQSEQRSAFSGASSSRGGDESVLLLTAEIQ